MRRLRLVYLMLGCVLISYGQAVSVLAVYCC
jgi:uncharacterized membrane protein YczE